VEAKTIEPGLEDRRHFLRGVASTAGFALIGCATTAAAPGAHAEMNHGDHGEAEVTPGEDLMQEHGVLERILLVYDEAVRRIEQNEAFEVSVVTSAAGIVRRFVEDYHERTEEQFVFPRLEAAHQQVELIAVLRRQHERGRQVTDDIVRMANAGASPQLAQLIRSFERMYRPHAAREDTVLFPAFRSVVGGAEYRELGEQFEQQEHARFGKQGFENAVMEVARLEATLGIGDLARFTPA
jgi:hemerythrin-like domain-containing protein